MTGKEGKRSPTTPTCDLRLLFLGNNLSSSISAVFFLVFGHFLLLFTSSIHISFVPYHSPTLIAAVLLSPATAVPFLLATLVFWGPIKRG